MEMDKELNRDAELSLARRFSEDPVPHLAYVVENRLCQRIRKVCILPYYERHGRYTLVGGLTCIFTRAWRQGILHRNPKALRQLLA